MIIIIIMILIRINIMISMIIHIPIIITVMIIIILTITMMNNDNHNTDDNDNANDDNTDNDTIDNIERHASGRGRGETTHSDEYESNTTVNWLNRPNLRPISLLTLCLLTLLDSNFPGIPYPPGNSTP